MVESKSFLRETGKTAAFAFREYFRPIVVVGRFIKSSFASSGVAESLPVADACAETTQATMEMAKALLRERLVKDRHREKLLLIQGVITVLVSMLALAISLMHAFDVELAIAFAILLPVSLVALWVILRPCQDQGRNRRVENSPLGFQVIRRGDRNASGEAISGVYEEEASLCSSQRNLATNHSRAARPLLTVRQRGW